MTIPVLSAGAFASWYAWDTAQRSAEQKQVLQTTVEHLQRERDTAELRAAFGGLCSRVESYANAAQDIGRAAKIAPEVRTPEVAKLLGPKLERYRAARDDLKSNQKRYLDPLQRLSSVQPRLHEDMSKLVALVTDERHEQQVNRLVSFLEKPSVTLRLPGERREIGELGELTSAELERLVADVEARAIELTTRLHELALDD